MNYEEIETVFLGECRGGNLEGAQRWLNMYPYLINRFDIIFWNCCPWGHINILQWLLTVKPDIDISENNEAPFRFACCNGYLEVAQWLLQMKPSINISERDDYAFTWSCANGHLELAQWLYQVKPSINISAKNDCPFRMSCYYGHLEVAQWLLQIKPEINIGIYDHEVFRIIFYVDIVPIKNLQIGLWLQSMYPCLYMLKLDLCGNVIEYKVRDKEEANWQRRKYLVYLASNRCSDKLKNNILYKLPYDVTRYLIGFV